MNFIVFVPFTRLSTPFANLPNSFAKLLFQTILVLTFSLFLTLFISYHEVQLLKLDTQLAKKLLPASPLPAPRIAWLKREEKLPEVEEGAKSGMGTVAG